MSNNKYKMLKSLMEKHESGYQEFMNIAENKDEDPWTGFGTEEGVMWFKGTGHYQNFDYLTDHLRGKFGLYVDNIVDSISKLHKKVYICEIGCGCGQYLMEFRNFCSKSDKIEVVKYFGIEVNNYICNEANLRIERHNIKLDGRDKLKDVEISNYKLPKFLKKKRMNGEIDDKIPIVFIAIRTFSQMYGGIFGLNVSTTLGAMQLETSKNMLVCSDSLLTTLYLRDIIHGCSLVSHEIMRYRHSQEMFHNKYYPKQSGYNKGEIWPNIDITESADMIRFIENVSPFKSAHKYIDIPFVYDKKAMMHQFFRKANKFKGLFILEGNNNVK